MADCGEQEGRFRQEEREHDRHYPGGGQRQQRETDREREAVIAGSAIERRGGTSTRTSGNSKNGEVTDLRGA